MNEAAALEMVLCHVRALIFVMKGRLCGGNICLTRLGSV